VYEIVIC